VDCRTIVAQRAPQTNDGRNWDPAFMKSPWLLEEVATG
jgi:hypothetical protein